MSIINQKKLFLFDFDGTLVDTSFDILDSVNHTRKFFNLPELTFAKAKIYIGIGRTALVEGIISDNKQNIPLQNALNIFTEHHLQHMFDHASFYHGVAETLKELEAHNKKLGIISNKYSVYIKKILEHLACPVVFDLIMGADALPTRKPDPAPLHQACLTLNIKEKDSIMIGDSEYDIRAGKAAGITTAACLYGFNDREHLAKEHPDLLLNNLPGTLNQLKGPEINLDKPADVTLNSNI